MPVTRPGAGGGVATLYDVPAAMAWWRAREQQRGESPRGNAEQERARKDRSQAELNELRLAERRGDLVAREQVIREGRGYVTACRQRLLALPRGLVRLGLVERGREGEARRLVLEALAELAAMREGPRRRRGAAP